MCRDEGGIKGKDVNCSIVFKYGMKRDFNAWLASLGPASPIKTLTELREWNLAHRAEGAIKYGQAQLDNSDEVDLERDRARYLADRATDVRMTGAEGIDAVMKRERLDALLFPGSTGAAVAAKPGYPTVIVPFGFVPNAPQPPFPAGFDAKPAPLGISFTGGRVQRAAAHRNRVRVRAGNEAQSSRRRNFRKGSGRRKSRVDSRESRVQSPESRPEMSRTVSVEVEQVGPSTGSARARSHTVFVDRPVEKGGGDRGPLGGRVPADVARRLFSEHAARRRQDA